MSVHDRWGGRRTGDGRRWEVRWRDRGQQRKRRFSSRAAADAWEATVTLRPGEGRPSVTVGSLWDEWCMSKSGLARSTLAGYESAWKQYVRPQWGSVPVTAITTGDVQRWVGGLQRRSESRARTALTVLSGMLRYATLRDLLESNPCAGVRWPPVSRAEVVPLTRAEVAALAVALHPYELEVWTLATTGIRFGELAGLRVSDLDAQARRLAINRSVTTVGGRLVESLPKSRERRSVPIPGWLADDLVADVEGRPSTDPLFPTATGGVWRKTSWRRLWVGEPARTGDRRRRVGALEVAGIARPVRVHDLRHTAAVEMLTAGVSPRTVQAVLGHASLTMTLEVYGRWVSPDLDAAAAVFDDVKRP